MSQSKASDCTEQGRGGFVVYGLSYTMVSHAGPCSSLLKLSNPLETFSGGLLSSSTSSQEINYVMQFSSYL